MAMLAPTAAASQIWPQRFHTALFDTREATENETMKSTLTSQNAGSASIEAPAIPRLEQALYAHRHTHRQYRRIPRLEQALYAGARYGALVGIDLAAALHHITFSAHWIPTADNLLADLLSRRQFAKIAELCPSCRNTFTFPLLSSLSLAPYSHRTSSLLEPPARPP
jgi:hypothetical protein